MTSKYMFILFFSIVFTVYALVNYYIYWHLKQWKPNSNWIYWAIHITFFIVVLAYPIGRIFERFYLNSLTEFIVKLGSIWLGAMLYFTLTFFAIDIIRFFAFIAGLIFKTPSISPLLLSSKSLLVVSISVASIVLYGFFNALQPTIKRIEIQTSKHLNPNGRIKLAIASDIHLGTVISNGRLSRMVSIINSQKPDAILLAGDIFDEDIGLVIKRNMGELISKLDAPLGVFAVTGNHEYIGGVNSAVDYLTKHGVQVLRDTSELVNNSFYIVGREDRQAKYMANHFRKSIPELVSNIDSEKFNILLDHQPYNLHEAYENGIDLQISGHTHHGQLWPFNYITSAIFQISYGYQQINGTHFYVSNGFGTWGPPLRVGNRPEIVIIDITTSPLI